MTMRLEPRIVSRTEDDALAFPISRRCLDSALNSPFTQTRRILEKTNTDLRIVEKLVGGHVVFVEIVLFIRYGYPG